MTLNTTEQLAVPPVPTGETTRPEFLRLPHAGQRCPHTGLTRSFINSLVLPTAANDFKPPVKSFCLRQRGAKTGVRLIDAASLASYIRQNGEGGAA